jgi:hypothetical protein
MSYDEVCESVKKKLNDKIPFSEWTHQELVFYAYEFAGFGCSSCQKQIS